MPVLAPGGMVSETVPVGVGACTRAPSTASESETGRSMWNVITGPRGNIMRTNIELNQRIAGRAGLARPVPPCDFRRSTCRFQRPADRHIERAPSAIARARLAPWTASRKSMRA